MCFSMIRDMIVLMSLENRILKGNFEKKDGVEKSVILTKAESTAIKRDPCMYFCFSNYGPSREMSLYSR